MVLNREVEQVTFPGSAGGFTVLPHHAQLIAQLAAGEIKYVEQGIEHSLSIAGGYVEVAGGVVETFVEEAAEPHYDI